MLRGSWTNRHVVVRAGVLSLSRNFLAVTTAVLLTGCGETSAPLGDMSGDFCPQPAWTEVSTSVGLPEEDQSPEPLPEIGPTSEIERPSMRLAGMMPVGGGPSDSERYWSFSEEADGPTLHLPALVRLPVVVEEPAVTAEIVVEEQPLALLLPPQAIETSDEIAAEPEFGTDLDALTEIVSEVVTEEISVVEASSLPVVTELSEQEKLLRALVRDSSTATTGVLTDARVNELAKSKIQRAYAMANRGSLYVARQELIEVLRLISQAKDAEQGSPQRSVALAAGLRALRESKDFEPRGTQLEAEMNTAVLCASHRTPLAQQPGSAELLPRLMMDRYLRYAQLQLSLSVAGEPAGSMALHALGKLHSQLGRVEPDKHRLAARHALAYQQAALLAHDRNFLAAHELGVLLATSGHFAEAEQLLLQVAVRSPNAVVYRNLARVQENLGRTAEAAGNLDYAQQLVQQGAVGTNNVQWVSPDAFANIGGRTARFRTARIQTARSRGPVGRPLPGQRQAVATQRWR